MARTIVLTMLMLSVALCLNAAVAVAGSYTDLSPEALYKAKDLAWQGAKPVATGNAFLSQSVGQEHGFKGESDTRATLAAVADRARIYVSRPGLISGDDCMRLANEVGQKICVQATSHFGLRTNKDEPVIVLVTPGDGQLSIEFSAPDLYRRNDYSRSNECCLIRVSMPEGAGLDELYYPLAHAYALSVLWREDPDEHTWLLEGLSQYSAYTCGYDHPQAAEDFLGEPTWSLTDWTTKPSVKQLGASYLFIHYLVDRYGGNKPDKFLQSLAQNRENGELSIDEVLRSAGTKDRFVQAFRDWVVTNAVNDPVFAEGRYSYKHFKGRARMTDLSAGLWERDMRAEKLPRNAAAYFQAEVASHWSPDFPTIHDQVTVLFEKPGRLIWAINDWKLPPREYWPQGSRQTTYQGRPVVATPLDAAEIDGLFTTLIGPFKHVTPVHSVNFLAKFDDKTSTRDFVVPISHDQNLSLPSLKVQFDGENGIFGSGTRRFNLHMWQEAGTEGDARRLQLDKHNDYEGLLPEFAVYYKRVVLMPTNVSGPDHGEPLEYSVRLGLEAGEANFERKVWLIAKLSETMKTLYDEIVQGIASAHEKREYLVVTRQLDTLNASVLHELTDDLDKGIFQNFAILENTARSLPVARAKAFEYVVGEVLPIVKAKIDHITNTGQVPDVRLDQLLFRYNHLRAWITDEAPGDGDGGEPVPGSAEELLLATGEIVSYLQSLPIDKTILNDILEKILGNFLITADDEIEKLLKAFGINISIDFTNLGLDHILGLIKLKSYKQLVHASLLESWSAGMNEEEFKSLQRLYLAEAMTQTGFKSAMAMADDASEGLYDLIDLIIGARKASETILGGLAHVPVLGHMAKWIKIKITQRLIWALNNGVQFVCSRLKEPWRSRVASVANAITTAYIKWKDIEIEEGLGGINAALFAKIGCKVVGKFLLIMPPKIGYVALTEGHTDEAGTMALNNDFYGTYDEAMLKVLDDGSLDTEEAVLERVVNTTSRKMALSKNERLIANVAGAIGQIAKYMHMVDPTSITRIVSLVSTVFAGGLQLHSIFNSVHYFYKIPFEVERGVALSFNPGADARGKVVGDREDPTALAPFVPMQRALSGRAAQSLAASSQAALKTLDDMAKLASKGKINELKTRLETYEDASWGLRKTIKAVQMADFGPARDENEVDFPTESLIKHDMQAAAICSRIVECAFDKNDKAKRKSLVQTIEGAGTQVQAVQERVEYALRRNRVRNEPRLDVISHGAVERKDGDFIVTATIMSVGGQNCPKLDAQLIVPTCFEVVKVQGAKHAGLNPGEECEVVWTVRPKGTAKREVNFQIQVESGNGCQASQIIFVVDR